MTKPVLQSELYNVLLRIAVQDSEADEGDEDSSRHETESAVAHDEPDALKDVRILVAEDNEINQDVTAAILASAGYSCDVVADGRQAVEAVKLTRYDLVLMDCQMPEMDGLEATRHIRDAERQGAAAHSQPVPIIALTANALKGDREQCLEAGMNSYLSKPLNPDELLRSIGSLLQVEARKKAPAAPPVDLSFLGLLESDSPEESAAGPMVDFDELVGRCMGNREIAERLIVKFCRKITADLESMSAGATASDADQVGRLAHGLKGAAANVACKEIRELAEQLEALGRAGDLSRAPALLHQLEEAHRKLMGDQEVADVLVRAQPAAGA